jgi:ABC-type maltose transport system permease subunit
VTKTVSFSLQNFQSKCTDKEENVPDTHEAKVFENIFEEHVHKVMFRVWLKNSYIRVFLLVKL